MEDQILNTHHTPELRDKAGRALIELGLWLRVGFIGACGVAGGVLQLFDGEVKPLSALALAASGGVLAAISWWRGRTVLDIVDGTAGVTAGVSSPASAASGGSASSLSSMRGRGSPITGAARRFAATRAKAS
jgi:hypothetical protein